MYSSVPKFLFCSFLCFSLFVEHLFVLVMFSWFFKIAYLCSLVALSIFKRIILNPLSSNSCISISIPVSPFLHSCISIWSLFERSKSLSDSLESVNGSLLCSFGGVVFPSFFMIPLALCRYLCIWRNSHFFLTLWTDFGKKRPLPRDGDMLELVVTLVSVMQSAKCKGMWWFQFWQGVLTHFSGHQSLAWSTTVWSLVSTAGSLQRLLRLLRSSQAPPVPTARDQGRQWW